MSVDKSMLDHLMAMPRKELVDDVIFYHDGWIAAGRECNELKAENAKLRELAQELYADQCDECDCWKYRDRMRELGIEVEP